jgi:23S rRNA C2498 (ribose-2'-O)-methylase RlmM
VFLSLDVLRAWCGEALMRGFVFNLKFAPAKAWTIAEEALRLRDELLAAPGGKWKRIDVRQLFHDRNAITMIGQR